MRRRSGTRRLSMAKRHCKCIISSIFRFFLSGKIRNYSFLGGADCMSSMLWHMMVSKHGQACNGYAHIHHFYFRWSGTRNKVTSKIQWHRWLLALERNCGTRCLPMANRHCMSMVSSIFGGFWELISNGFMVSSLPSVGRRFCSTRRISSMGSHSVDTPLQRR